MRAKQKGAPRFSGRTVSNVALQIGLSALISGLSTEWLRAEADPYSDVGQRAGALSGKREQARCMLAAYADHRSLVWAHRYFGFNCIDQPELWKFS